MSRLHLSVLVTAPAKHYCPSVTTPYVSISASTLSPTLSVHTPAHRFLLTMPVAPVNDDGAVLHYEDSGAPDGSGAYLTVVVVHGFMYHSRTWVLLLV